MAWEIKNNNVELVMEWRTERIFSKEYLEFSRLNFDHINRDIQHERIHIQVPPILSVYVLPIFELNQYNLSMDIC